MTIALTAGGIIAGSVAVGITYRREAPRGRLQPASHVAWAHEGAAPRAARAPATQPPAAVVRGLAIATAEGDAAELGVAVTTWSLHAPADAVAFARRQPESIRAAVMKAVLENLARRPALGVALGRQLLADEPDRADEYGTTLLAALLRGEAFAEALELAGAGPAEFRAEWMGAVMGAWARREPTAARELGALLAQHGVVGEPWRAVVRGWAESAPAQLAEQAIALPAGDARTVALEAALDRWIQNEPVAAAAWLERRPASPERDRALATLLARTDTAVRSTATALTWANQIVDPQLRVETTIRVVREMAADNEPLAQAYLEHTGDWTTEQRRQLRTALDPPARRLGTAD